MKCTKCDLHLGVIRLEPVPGDGDPHADLMLIGEAPGMNEDIYKIPFIGQAGILLDHILGKLSLNRDQLWITNCLKCRPPQNKLPCKREMDVVWPKCRTHLDREIRTVKPKVIVLLGGLPLQLLAGKRFITRWEGMELKDTGLKPRVFACFHPAYVLRAPSKEGNIGSVLYAAAKAAGLKVKRNGGVMYDYEIRT